MNPPANPPRKSRLLTAGRLALLYGVVAALWIVTSGALLVLSFDDPAVLGRFELAKGLLFVLVTSGLLFFVLKQWRDPAAEPLVWNQPALRSGDFRWRFLAIVALMAVVPLAGFVVVQVQGPRIEREAFANLSAIADLKASQIESWLYERHNDGEVIMSSAAFIRQVVALQQPEAAPAVLDDVRERLLAAVDAVQYDAALLVDTQGKTLVEIGSFPGLPAQTAALLPRALASFLTLHSEMLADTDGQLYLDLVVPLPLFENNLRLPAGAVILRIKPEQNLLPSIQHWPTASASGETLLVRRDGDAVLYINKLRHRQGENQSLRMPMSRTDMPAVVAVNEGRSGSHQGPDYRGVPVFAAYRPVTGTEWMVVAKADRDEVLAPLRYLGFWVSVIALLAILAVSAVMLLFWRQRGRTLQLEMQVQADRMLQKFFDLPFIGIAISSPTTKHWLKCNDRLCEILGYSREEMINLSWQEMTHPEDLAADVAAFDKVLRGESDGYMLDKRFVRKDGVTVYTSIDVRCQRNDNGQPEYVFATVQDITERQEAQEQLKLSAKVFEQSAEGVIITDPELNIVMVNRAFSKITGYSAAEAHGQNPRLMSSGRHDSHFYRDMWDTIHSEGYWHGEMWNRRKDGDLYPELVSISQVLDDDGLVSHYVGIFSDISEHKASQAHIHRLAHFDSLTGLPNRSLLADRVGQAISRVERNGEPLAIIFLDLDRFKNVNDSLGHRIGDELLIQVAERLREVLRDEDTVSRLGGDEFILVLPAASADGAAHVAEKVLKSLSRPYRIEQHELSITPSLGIAMYPADGETYETLSMCADAAMYRAKQSGRNTYRFFTREMQERSERTLQLENALRRVLELNQLELHYQPQIALESGRIIGVEALLRWQHPELGRVAPNDFIPVAEDSGLILPIGEWVLRAAVRQMTDWMAAGLAPMVMAVNLSAVQFRQANLPELVTQILDEYRLPPHCLELELTEGVAMDDPLAAIAVMNDLHERGIRMSIDDFGTGYSSLSYLKRFKVYKLKIDQSFVRDMSSDPEDAAIVATIIGLSQNLGLQTIAEGVETAEQMAFLRERGCDEVQGYYVSRPLPAADFESFVRGFRPEQRRVGKARQ